VLLIVLSDAVNLKPRFRFRSQRKAKSHARMTLTQPDQNDPTYPGNSDNACTKDGGKCGKRAPGGFYCGSADDQSGHWTEDGPCGNLGGTWGPVEGWGCCRGAALNPRGTTMQCHGNQIDGSGNSAPFGGLCADVKPKDYLNPSSGDDAGDWTCDGGHFESNFCAHVSEFAKCCMPSPGGDATLKHGTDSWQLSKYAAPAAAAASF